MKILVIRFRQMGDAILATPLLSTLRANFPDAQIDFVLNERIAPLFKGSSRAEPHHHVQRPGASFLLYLY